jgi:hypothetical protein
MALFGPKDVARGFILDNLAEMSARQYFEQPQFAEFRRGIAGKPAVVAAKEYFQITNANMAECTLAVDLAKALFS